MITHWAELRRRMMHAGLVFLLLFIVSMYYSSDLFHYFMRPVWQGLSAGQPVIATELSATVITPMLLALDTAALFSMPVVLYQLWRFVAPGLYRHERRFLRQVVGASMVFFLLGVAFCFYIILPAMFSLFAQAAPKGVQLMPDMTRTFDFIIRMLLIFGCIFQTPLACLCLARVHLVTTETLKVARPYVIVAAFIVGMLLTPPDVLSQMMLALPICLCYEVGVFMVARVERRYRCQAISDGSNAAA